MRFAKYSGLWLLVLMSLADPLQAAEMKIAAATGLAESLRIHTLSRNVIKANAGLANRAVVSTPEKRPLSPDMLRVGRTRRISTASPATVPCVAAEVDRSAVDELNYSAIL
jgi:hypothetical protein